MGARPLPVGSYVTQDPRASCKRLVGCFSEAVAQDAPDDSRSKASPVTLRRMPGIRQPAGFGDGSGLPVRGMWEMAGVEYVVIGPNLYSVAWSPITQIAALTKVNGATNITGFGFVRMTDNGACLVILEPGTANAWTYTPFAGGGGFQVLSNSFFVNLGGAIDCWFIDSMIVFLAANPPSTLGYGSMTFFNDDGRLVSGNAQITFTTAASFTREFGTDPFIGGAVDHREMMLIGARSGEGYVNTGNPTGTPFSSAPDSFLALGCHPLCAYSIASQDQSFFWVANDKTVRRRNGQTPLRVSNSGVENILGTSDLTGCYALTPTVYGHPLWILTMPNAGGANVGRTIAYDALTNQWFELQSGNLGSWRPLCYHNGLGLQLLGDSQSDAVGIIDEANFLEFGATQLCQITTQALYDDDKRFTERRLELVITMGGSTSATYAPIVDLYISDDSAKTFMQFSDPQNLGTQGQNEGTGQRATWWNLGQSRNRVHMFQITDASPLFTVDIQAMIEGGGEVYG
jgi:hypothetical protein